MKKKAKKCALTKHKTDSKPKLAVPMDEDILKSEQSPQGGTELPTGIKFAADQIVKSLSASFIKKNLEAYTELAK